MAIQSPLLETSIDQARGVILSFISSPDIGLDEVDEAATMVTGAADPDANVIWGISFDSNMVDSMKVTVIATGFENGGVKQPKKEEVVEKTYKEISSRDEDIFINWFDSPKGSIAEDDDYLSDVISILKKNSNK